MELLSSHEPVLDMPLHSRILHVDDHPLFRAGLASLFEAEPDFELVGQAAGILDTLELAARLEPDVIVIDMRLADGDGIELTRALLARRREHILALSALEEPMRAVELLRAGAVGFALKQQPAEEIIAAVRAVRMGTSYVAPSLRESIAALTAAGKLPLERLTNRERQIFELLVRGKSNQDIGEQLHIATRTVDTHRQHVMRKLDAHSLADLVRLAVRWGIAS